MSMNCCLVACLGLEVVKASRVNFALPQPSGCFASRKLGTSASESMPVAMSPSLWVIQTAAFFALDGMKCGALIFDDGPGVAAVVLDIVESEAPDGHCILSRFWKSKGMRSGLPTMST